MYTYIRNRFYQLCYCYDYILTKQSAGYEYEPPGSEYKYHFKSSTGHLENITTLFDNDAIITVEYNNTQLPQYFRRSDGDQLNVVYNENNLISSVSLVDRYGNVKYSRSV